VLRRPDKQKVLSKQAWLGGRVPSMCTDLYEMHVEPRVGGAGTVEGLGMPETGGEEAPYEASWTLKEVTCLSPSTP